MLPPLSVNVPGLPNPSTARVSGAPPDRLYLLVIRARQGRASSPPEAASAVLRGFGVRDGRRGPTLFGGLGLFSLRSLAPSASRKGYRATVVDCQAFNTAARGKRGANPRL